MTSSAAGATPPTSVSEDLVLAKARMFVTMRVWPLKATLNPEGWLRNFESDEKEHAVNLLNAFLYFSSEMVDALFIAAFQQLSSIIVSPDEPFLSAQSSWQQFMDSALIVHVEGEQPNPADSGYRFARRARAQLGIPEERILNPMQALEWLVDRGARPVVFVDDFVGSGSQFVSTWFRRIGTHGGSRQLSFDQVAAAVGGRFFYASLFCTEMGRDIIESNCSPVILCPAHLLTDRYNVLSRDCHLLPAHLKPTLESFVRNASLRAGIPDSGSSGWRGFKGLGLAMAIDDTVPDATLPLFYWEQNGWIPLIRRR